MGFLYKYVDSDDDIVKYVGIVNGDDEKSLDNRISQHRNDSWYKDSFRIYYFTVKTKTDLEFLEACFINYYETYNFYNISKSGWGESQLVDLSQFEWSEYRSSKEIELEIRSDKRKRIKTIKNEINELLYEISALESKNRSLMDKLEKLDSIERILEKANEDKVVCIATFPFHSNDLRMYYKLTKDTESSFFGIRLNYRGEFEEEFKFYYDNDNGIIMEHRTDSGDEFAPCGDDSQFSVENPWIGIMVESCRGVIPYSNEVYVKFFIALNSELERLKLYSDTNDHGDINKINTICELLRKFGVDPTGKCESHTERKGVNDES